MFWKFLLCLAMFFKKKKQMALPIKKEKGELHHQLTSLSFLPSAAVHVHVRDLIQKHVEHRSHLAVHGVCISMDVNSPEAKTPGNLGFSLMTLNK